MPELDREHVKDLIEKTPEESLRGILMMMLTLIERQDEDRSRLSQHQFEEEVLLKRIAADPEAHFEQHAYISSLMEAQAAALADRAALRKAIIEKSLSGLIWAAVAFAGSRLWGILTTHWAPK